MTRGDVLRPLRLRPLQERAELEIAIAGNAWVGRAAVEIAARKRPDHRAGELRAQIEQRVRDPEKSGHRLRPEMIGAILRLLALAFPQAQRNPRHLITFLQQN